MTVRLSLRAAPGVPLEAATIRPDVFAGLGEAEIEKLPLRHGREAVRLGDFFDVRGGRSDDVRVAGDLWKARRLGARTAGGRLLLEGRAGMHTAVEMTGGVVRVEGDVDDWAGAAMAGGRLEIQGSAGAHLGGALPGCARGMTGGSIHVLGSAGDEAAFGMRRGTVVLSGSAGARAGAHMIAGTLAVFGALGPAPGLGMKRGTILAGGPLELLLPTFRYACTYRPAFLAVLFASLRRGGSSVPERLASGAFRRYSGDFTELGRGEILEWRSA